MSIFPLALRRIGRSATRCDVRIAWPSRRIANPVGFTLGSSNLPRRA